MAAKIVYENFKDWSEGILEGLRGLRVKISRCLGIDREGDFVISFIAPENFYDLSEISDNNESKGNPIHFYPQLKISIPIDDEEGEFIPLTINERKNLASFIRQQVFYPMHSVEISEDEKNTIFTFSNFYIGKRIDEELLRSVVYDTLVVYEMDDEEYSK